MGPNSNSNNNTHAWNESCPLNCSSFAYMRSSTVIWVHLINPPTINTPWNQYAYCILHYSEGPLKYISKKRAGIFTFKQSALRCLLKQMRTILQFMWISFFFYVGCGCWRWILRMHNEGKHNCRLNCKCKLHRLPLLRQLQRLKRFFQP